MVIKFKYIIECNKDQPSNKFVIYSEEYCAQGKLLFGKKIFCSFFLTGIEFFKYFFSLSMNLFLSQAG